MHNKFCIAIRVDASARIGTGHLRRCLSLAQVFLDYGAIVHLLIRPIDSVSYRFLHDFSNAVNLEIHWLPAPDHLPIHSEAGPPHAEWSGVKWSKDAIDVINAMGENHPHWMILDHYSFDERWHTTVCSSLGCKLMVIDDLADRSINADILLDQNWNASHRDKYQGKIRRDLVWMVGPAYALLDRVYQEKMPYQVSNQVKTVGIFMGGTDPGQSSLKALRACRKSGFIGPVEVVSTSANPSLQALRNACILMSDTTLTLNEPNLASFFLRHDLHIGAGGSATWERCCMAAPTIAVALAKNQYSVLEPMREMNILEIADNLEEDLVIKIANLISNPKKRHKMSKNSRQMVDGKGVYRVANFLLDYDQS